jgi:hypothetical protein
VLLSLARVRSEMIRCVYTTPGTTHEHAALLLTAVRSVMCPTGSNGEVYAADL